MNFELIAEQACESLITDLNDGHCVDVDPVDYADDFWFAGYCLSTSFHPTPNQWDAVIAEIQIDYILDLVSRGFDYQWCANIAEAPLPF